MQTIIQPPHLKLSKRLERAVIKKFKRLDQISDRIIRCDVLLRKEKSGEQNGFIVEAKLSVPGKDLFAMEAAGKFEIAAEYVYHELMRQLRKHKVIGKR